MTDAHDITGGLDLLGDWLDAKGFTEEAGLCTRAMDEINRLRLELDMQQAMVVVPSQKDDRNTIEALRAENARLLEENERFRKMHDEMLLVANAVAADVKEQVRAAMGESDE